MRLSPLVTIEVALALSACVGEVQVDRPTGRVALEVAPLSLAGVVDACYGVTVLNEALEPVWSRAGLCASDYGDGRSALSYVGTCDASDTNGDTVANNTVVLKIEGLFAPGPITDFRDPCAAPYAEDGCRLTVPCRENADARVEFNLTVMREANQGFFDVAVTFEDIFCSAKVDCATVASETSPSRPLELVFDPATGQRVPSVVWALACTDGDPGGETPSATHIYMDDLVLRCGETRYTIDAADGPGNVYPGGVGAPAPIVQAMVFEGRETVRNGAVDADKLYWNVALGLNADFFEPEPPALAPNCVLETKATAHRGPLAAGVSPLNTNYPYVSVSVPLNVGGDIVCTQHPLDGEPPNDGVATAYTGPNADLSGFASATFGNVLRLGASGVESTPIDFDECAELSPCGPNTSCSDLSGGFECTCLAGHSGNPYTSGCVDIDECDIESDNCHIDATCTNTPGTFECDCLPGYAGDGLTCTDVNGCLTDNGGCSANASCGNQPGPNVICQCLPGFTGDGLTCTDIDECLIDNGGCSANATCTNTPGGRTCVCNGGLSGDGLSCVQGLVVSANTTDYNVFVAAGSPSTPRDIVVTVNAGVTIGASSTSVAAFRTGALPVGSTVRLVNNGNIYGAGGRGGSAGDSNFGATAGSPGGDAIAATAPLTIDNTNGQIFGGGGGGGGGNLCTRSNVLACGGSGGGGRGQVGGAAGSKGTCASGAAYPNGTSGGGGSVSGAGGGGGNASSGYYPNQFGAPFYCTSGAGGAGGDWGQAGNASGQAILDGGVQYGANAGGAAGYAVRLSGGATLGWLGGNTAARVKGLAQ